MMILILRLYLVPVGVGVFDTFGVSHTFEFL